MHDLIRGGGQRKNHPPHISIVVDHETLVNERHEQTIAETVDGHPLSDEAIQRCACDAVVRRVVLDAAGVPIDVGRTERIATPAQRAALHALYSTCGFQGCDVRVSHCQAHHIHYWEHGGPTDLNNLVPLCSHHHHLAHEGGWVLELLDDRRLRITRPDGAHHATTSPPTRCSPPTFGW